MKGNCPNCPVQMDPPHIAINITQVGQPSLFAYYCKWECASKDVSSVLAEMASGLTPAEYTVPEAQVQMPVYAKGTVWTAPDPFHQKVVEHNSPTAMLAANLVLRLQEAMKTRDKFGNVKAAQVTFRDYKHILDFDEHLYMCPMVEWKMGGWRLLNIIAGPDKVLIQFNASTSVYNLALDPVHFSLSDDFDRILAHIEAAIARLYGGRLAPLQAMGLQEETATIQAQAIHIAGDPVPAPQV